PAVRCGSPESAMLATLAVARAWLRRGATARSPGRYISSGARRTNMRLNRIAARTSRVAGLAALLASGCGRGAAAQEPATATAAGDLVARGADCDREQVGAILPRLPPTPTFTASTVPSNGDVNPYGVAFVPRGFPRGGLLRAGDVIVSNFNDSDN